MKLALATTNFHCLKNGEPRDVQYKLLAQSNCWFEGAEPRAELGADHFQDCALPVT